MISNIKHQAQDLLAELKRVDWPSKSKVLSSTGAVVVVSAFVGLFLYLADLAITWGMSFVLPMH
ncbi:MAG: preprotein translocase subunit SecE [Firmicutes bacterium]|nr:preprotein translocase subunit SecE [Bacillota bacterium]